MKMKFWQQNTVKAARKPGEFIRSLAAAIVPVYILATIVSSYAEDPSAAIIVNFKGNGLNLRRGTNRNVTPVRTGQRYVLENPNDVLYVPGDRSSTVRFAFAIGQVWESGGLRVQTNPSDTPSEYRFPCRGSGGFAISWRPQGETQDRACREGVTLGTSGDLNTQLPLSNPFNLVQAAKNILTAQASKEVVVVPSQGRTIIQTNSTGNDVLVDVAEGNVLVKSDKNPAGRTVRAGERYSYARNTVTPINRNALLNSPSMQEFLNPNNWSSPDIPQRVADQIAKQVADDRSALGLPTRSVASTSGVNVSGEWIFESGWFDGSCRVSTAYGVGQGSLTITQNGNQLNLSGLTAVGNNITSGTVSGNQFEAVGVPSTMDKPLRWIGTISDDGNQITGTATCGSTASQPFTMTRKSSQASAQNDYCNSRTVTQPTMQNGAGNTLYRVWMDFSRGQEAISPAACGRWYWVKDDDPNHYNYGIRFVYLVDGQGKCVVPYLYKETGGGNLEVVRPAAECSSGSQRPER